MAEFEDVGVSGATHPLERPAGAKAFAEGRPVVVAKLDRLTSKSINPSTVLWPHDKRPHRHLTAKYLRDDIFSFIHHYSLTNNKMYLIPLAISMIGPHLQRCTTAFFSTRKMPEFFKHDLQGQLNLLIFQIAQTLKNLRP